MPSKIYTTYPAAFAYGETLDTLRAYGQPRHVTQCAVWAVGPSKTMVRELFMPRMLHQPTLPELKLAMGDTTDALRDYLLAAGPETVWVSTLDQRRDDPILSVAPDGAATLVGRWGRREGTYKPLFIAAT